MVTHNIAFCRYILAEEDVPEDDRLKAQSIIDDWEVTQALYQRVLTPPKSVCQRGEELLAEITSELGALPGKRGSL